MVLFVIFNLKNLKIMKNRKKLAKGVIALSMALSFGTAILAPTHEAVASGGSNGYSSKMAYSILCYDQNSCRIVSAGATCVSGYSGCIPNPCPPGTTPDY